MPTPPRCEATASTSLGQVRCEHPLGHEPSVHWGRMIFERITYTFEWRGQHPEPEAEPKHDSLGEWMYHRYHKLKQVRVGWNAQPWSQINEMERLYWEHEADAVRRAVLRGGFKDYNPVLSGTLEKREPQRPANDTDRDDRGNPL